jgi:hypothetical protein
MSQPPSKRKRTLQIHISFEVSRLSSQYLANAYEQILPPVHRATSTTPLPPAIDFNGTSQSIGEDNYECL